MMNNKTTETNKLSVKDRKRMFRRWILLLQSIHSWQQRFAECLYLSFLCACLMICYFVLCRSLFLIPHLPDCLHH